MTNLNWTCPRAVIVFVSRVMSSLLRSRKRDSSGIAETLVRTLFWTARLKHASRCQTERNPADHFVANHEVTRHQSPPKHTLSRLPRSLRSVLRRGIHGRQSAATARHSVRAGNAVMWKSKCYTESEASTENRWKFEVFPGDSRFLSVKAGALCRGASAARFTIRGKRSARIRRKAQRANRFAARVTNSRRVHHVGVTWAAGRSGREIGRGSRDCSW